MSISRFSRCLLPFAAVALAFALRLYQLPSLPPGLSFDEASNLLDAERLGPGYHPVFFGYSPLSNAREAGFAYAQAAVIQAFGSTPWALRLASALAGTLTVAVLYRALREMWPPDAAGAAVAVAALAALLLAASYWHLHLSRVGLRAVALPPLLLAGAAFLFHAYWRGGAWSALVGGALLGLSLYTYLAARVVPVLLLLFLCWLLVLRRRSPRLLGKGALLVAAGLAVAVLPLADYALTYGDEFWGRTASVRVSSAAPIARNLLATAGMFSLRGETNGQYNLPGRPVFDPAGSVLFYLGLATAGASLWRQGRSWLERRGEGTALPPEVAGFLLLVLVVMLSPSYLSDSSPQFLRSLGAAPAVVALAAVGGVALSRLLRARFYRLGLALATLLVAVSAAFSVGDYFWGFAASDDAYRAFDTPMVEAAQYAREASLTRRVYIDPALLYHHPTVAYYLRGSEVAAFDPRTTAVLPAGPAEYLFLSYNQDLPAFEARAAAAGAVLERGRYTDREGRELLVSYRLDAFAQPSAEEAVARYGDSFVLLEAGVGAGDAAAQPSPVEVVAGEPFEVALRFLVERVPTGDLLVSLRVEDVGGMLWVSDDARPGEGSYPSALWRPGEVVIAGHEVSLPDDAPPGGYRLSLVMYDLDAGRALPVAAEGRPVSAELPLGRLSVARPSPLAAEAFRPRLVLEETLLPGVTLAGASVPEGPIAVGGDLRVDLLWTVQRTPPSDFAVRLELVDARGQRHLLAQGPPLHGAYSPLRWRPGDAFHDVHQVRLPPGAAQGPSTLLVSLVAPKAGGPKGLPGPQVEAPARRYEAPAMAYTLEQDFAGLARLLGFDLDGVEAPSQPALLGELRGGETVIVTLYWRALAATATTYSVSVQLLNEGGRLAAQHDGPPAEGRRPTSGWWPPEVIADAHALRLPESLPAGRYRLQVVLYEPSSGQRLGTAGRDAAELGLLEVSRP